MVRVDGENIKENTWYTMKNGEIIEVSEKWNGGNKRCWIEKRY